MSFAKKMNWYWEKTCWKDHAEPKHPHELSKIQNYLQKNPNILKLSNISQKCILYKNDRENLFYCFYFKKDPETTLGLVTISYWKSQVAFFLSNLKSLNAPSRQNFNLVHEVFLPQAGPKQVNYFWEW